MRVLQVVHGWPPERTGGTEHYAWRLHRGLSARGHDVHTLAAAFSPGEPMYAVRRTPEATRIVQNAPYAGLRRGESDPLIDEIIGGIARDFRPDLVHVQHLSFLSCTWRIPVPMVFTLHDAWAWCPAGGQLLKGQPPGERQPCAGPSPSCVACASAWTRDPPALSAALGLAGRLGRVVSPARLQRAWRRLPGALRKHLLAGDPPPLSSSDLSRRDANVRALLARSTLVSPSRFLADAAAAQGFRRPLVVPHGVDPAPADASVVSPDAVRRARGGSLPGGAFPRVGSPSALRPFVFLGTLSWHKGPDLVRAAWAEAKVAQPLHVYGPPGADPAFSVPNDGLLQAGEVPAILAGAQALVLGSRWPENAPLAVLEARAAGCPVIAPAIGGLPEIVADGVDGWLYPPGDRQALSRAIRAAAEIRRVPSAPPTFSDHLDALAHLYSTILDATVPGSTALDSTALDSTALDSTALDPTVAG